MSISNLFSPNPYDLFCHTITPSGGIPAVATNNIDAVNPGDTLNIGAVNAGIINVGHAGINTNLLGTLRVADIRSNSYQALTSTAMNIGSLANGLNLTPSIGDIIIDDQAPTADVLALGTINVGTVDIGRLNGPVLIGKAGGTITAGCPIVFPGGGAISSRVDMVPLSATAQGAFIVPIPNFVLFEGYSENNIVHLRWRFTGSITAATALSILSMASSLPVGFRPVSPLLVPSISVGGIGPVSNFPGFYVLQPSGTHGFGFLDATHGGLQGWSITENCGIGEGSITFSTV